MFKGLLTLMLTSSGLMAVILFANTASAASVLENVAASNPPVVNLNLASPSLKLTNQENNSIRDAFGCTCSACIGKSTQQSSL